MVLINPLMSPLSALIWLPGCNLQVLRLPADTMTTATPTPTPITRAGIRVQGLRVPTGVRPPRCKSSQLEPSRSHNPDNPSGKPLNPGPNKTLTLPKP